MPGLLLLFLRKVELYRDISSKSGLRSSLLLLPAPLLPVVLGVRRVRRRVVDVGGLGGGGGRRGRRLLVQGQLVHHGGERLAVVAEAGVLSAASVAAGVDSVGPGVSLNSWITIQLFLLRDHS